MQFLTIKMLVAAIVGPLSLHLRTPPRSRAPAPACKTASPTAALLFDCDGVIVETEELHRLAYNSAFDEFGLEVGGAPVVWDVPYYDRLQNTVGGGKPKMKWHFVNTCGGAWPTCTRRDGRTPADEAEGMALIDELQDAKTEAYKKIVDRAASPRPGVLELMDAAIAAPNLAVGICSAATRGGFERVVNSIVGAERLARLDVVIAGDDITNKKPDPEIYNVAAARLGLGAACRVGKSRRPEPPRPGKAAQMRRRRAGAPPSSRAKRRSFARWSDSSVAPHGRSRNRRATPVSRAACALSPRSPRHPSHVLLSCVLLSCVPCALCSTQARRAASSSRTRWSDCAPRRAPARAAAHHPHPHPHNRRTDRD